MTIAYVIAGIAALLTAFAFYVAISFYLDFRASANKLLSVAVDQFDKAVNGLLETPQDLPDEVLSLLRMMGETAFQPKSEWALLKAIQTTRPSSGGNPTVKAVKSLRPELQKLFTSAAVAWLDIMTHKSTLSGLRIDYALFVVKASAGKIPPAPSDAAIPAMGEMARTARPDLCAA